MVRVGVIVVVGEAVVVGKAVVVGVTGAMGVTVGSTGPAGGSVASGVSVGSTGPAGGSVASVVGEGLGVSEGPMVGNGKSVAVSVGVEVGCLVQVGRGVGVGLVLPDGKATITRLMIMLPTMTMLSSHRIFWLVVCLVVLRLLTTTNLHEKCLRIIPQVGCSATHGTGLTECSVGNGRGTVRREGKLAWKKIALFALCGYNRSIRLCLCRAAGQFGKAGYPEERLWLAAKVWTRSTASY